MRHSPLDTSFVRLAEVPPVRREADHGGAGPIAFRRLLHADAFASAIDFVDVSVIAPGSTIGAHTHTGNEELYFVTAGAPLVTVAGRTSRLGPGDLAVVRSGQWHELRNDTAEPVEIFVVQVAL